MKNILFNIFCFNFRFFTSLYGIPLDAKRGTHAILSLTDEFWGEAEFKSEELISSQYR